MASAKRFAQRIGHAGAVNGLTQTLLKLTVPGVPDFYQGTEFWDLAMVDPDNRRPVDFAARAVTLREVDTPDWGSLTRDWRDGRIKLTEKGNSGVALRAPPKGDPAFDGMEFQVADLRYNEAAKESELTAGIYRAIAPTKQVYKPTEWNTVRIELTGERLKGTVNGEVVQDVDLSKYQGKVIMFVNVASKCGYTPQYEGLEKLNRELSSKGFAVLGFPSNDFGAQEPGTPQEIAASQEGQVRCQTRRSRHIDPP